ncbi:MAG: VIT1/CCC1 transporter family protein [Acidimicrobiia bacterium]
MPIRIHRETHRRERIGWLRAGVLGAQDGIGSTASLLIGVTAASSSRTAMLVAGAAALVGGAMSMAAGEYSSVSSQRDTELADIARETHELARYPEHELEELTQIYEERGLDRDLAAQVATSLMKSDPLGSHVRDELGIQEETRARPVQAALVSAASFAVGAGLALIVSALAPADIRIAVIACISLVLLALLGTFGARLGGAPPARAALRITVTGGLAMAVTAVVGLLVGTAV